MIVYGSFRYRVYPTEKQVARLAQWNDALRFLWNLALEQRLMGLRRTDKRYPSAFDQINELTELRSDLSWLANAPRSTSNHLLVDLDKAFQRWFKRLADKPRFKRKGQDVLGFTEPDPRAFWLRDNTLHFPKLGKMRAVVHRPLEGKPKTCTLTRDVDQWFVSIVCEVEIDPVPRTEPVVALDRGVTNLVADSDGQLIDNPRHLARTARQLARAQRVVARRKKGSRNREKAKARVARLYRRVRRQRGHVLHEVSARYAKSHGTVIIEKLQVRNMTASAKGTVDEPGRNVRQKAGLNRSILDAGWSTLAFMLGYKLAWGGGQLVEVEPAYSSQTCAVCGRVDAESRHGERFCCTGCGNHDHADVNAAKVLKARANRSCQPVEASPLGGLRSRKAKRLRVPRRCALQSS